MATKRAAITETIKKDMEARELPREADRVPLKDALRAYSVRLPERDIKALQAHFEAMGLKLGQGLRMIIKEYMKKGGV